MFSSARIKLTLWYLIIILIISGIFSFAIYKVLIFEIEKGLKQQARRNIIRYRIEKKLPPNNPPSDLDLLFFELKGEDKVIFEEAKKRIITDLTLINLGILIIAGGLGYFLAGKTLKPIEIMVEEQKCFITDTSHELRTPLTAIKTENEVALRDKKFTLPQAINLIKSNLEEINKMQSLTNYLLSLDKYQSNYQRNLQPLSAQDIVNLALDKLKKPAARKQIKFVKKIQDINFYGDKISLVELLTILVDNALKYSPAKSSIIIQTTVVNKKLLIKVQDFGIGIKPQDLPHIFKRFYRADHSRNKSQGDGYGLGLAIAKNIVEIHQGKISVHSLPDQGSTFIIELPIT
jgi:signal transduction histidine kinase